MDSPFEMTYGPCQDQSSSLPDLGRLALRIISRPTGRLPQVGERTHAKATQTETSPPLHSASPSSTLHHTFTTDLTLVSCGCSKCSIYRSEAGCLEGYCCLAHPLRKEQTGAADAYKRHQCRLFISIYQRGSLRIGFGETWVLALFQTWVDRKTMNKNIKQ